MLNNVNMFNLSISIFLPWLVGMTFMNLVYPDRFVGKIPFIIGYGYIVGTFIVVASIYIFDIFALNHDFGSLSTFLIVILILLILAKTIFAGKRSVVIDYKRDNSFLLLLSSLFILLTIIHIFYAIVNNILTPLFPWDAWWHWIAKSKIWFYSKSLVPVTDAATWLSDGSGIFYTMDNYAKSNFTSLVAYWSALGLGEWRDSIIMLHWNMCMIAMVTALFGQLRLNGVSLLVSSLTIFVVVSMPILGMHHSLAGYADIWLATILCMVVMSFIQWFQTRNIKDAALVIVLVMLAWTTKAPAFYWTLGLTPALFYAIKKTTIMVMFLIASISIVFVFPLYKPIDFTIPLIGHIVLTDDIIYTRITGIVNIQYHDISAPFIANLFVYDNWNILWYFIVVYLAIFIFPSNNKSRLENVEIILAITLISMLYFVFFWTNKYIWVVDGTTINRATLHILPSVIFLIVMRFRPDNTN